MKFLFDLLPVILFFIIFKWAEGHTEAAQALASQYLFAFMSHGQVSTMQAPILLATAVSILTIFFQIIFLWIQKKKIKFTLWVSFFIITIFGGATIYFNNDTFIKWKPTVLYWFFAVALAITQFGFGKNFIQTMMGKQITLPEDIWVKVAWSWMGFFVFMGILNIVFAFNFSTDTWVNFKLFGVTGLMLAFVIGQSIYLSKYVKRQEPSNGAS